MMKVATPIFGIAIALSLVGCTKDDPNKGGLLGGLIGLGSGTYEKRVDDETAMLKAEKVRYQEEVESNEQLDRSLREGRERAAGLEREVASLWQEMDGLDAEITALQSEEGVTKDEVEKAEAEVALLRDDIDRIEAEQQAHDLAKSLGADADQDTDPAAFGEPASDQPSDLRAYINKLQEAVDALKSARAMRADQAVPEPGAAAE